MHSEPSAQTIRRAHVIHPLTAVQSEYSLFERDAEVNGVLETVRELCIGFVAFSLLGRGFLAGRIYSQHDLPEGYARRMLPRFGDDNIARNLQIVDSLSRIGDRLGATPAQLALAWLVRQGAVPIPGTKRRKYLEENLRAAEISFTSEDLAEVERVSPPGVRRDAKHRRGDAAGQNLITAPDAGRPSDAGALSRDPVFATCTTRVSGNSNSKASPHVEIKFRADAQVHCRRGAPLSGQCPNTLRRVLRTCWGAEQTHIRSGQRGAWAGDAARRHRSRPSGRLMSCRHRLVGTETWTWSSL